MALQIHGETMTNVIIRPLPRYPCPCPLPPSGSVTLRGRPLPDTPFLFVIFFVNYKFCVAPATLVEWRYVFANNRLAYGEFLFAFLIIQIRAYLTDSGIPTGTNTVILYF